MNVPPRIATPFVPVLMGGGRAFPLRDRSELGSILIIAPAFAERVQEVIVGWEIGLLRVELT